MTPGVCATPGQLFGNDAPPLAARVRDRLVKCRRVDQDVKNKLCEFVESQAREEVFRDMDRLPEARWRVMYDVFLGRKGAGHYRWRGRDVAEYVLGSGFAHLAELLTGEPRDWLDGVLSQDEDGPAGQDKRRLLSLIQDAMLESFPVPPAGEKKTDPGTPPPTT